ncbi:hypothetical protein LO763_28170 [Glycomyces sp. A-F 0318]|uniref:hypothetical protein n=1 Tax=Glycomyces amatae TaxID=2881355 RepID=UPI001E4BE787|nr:hypothetical protein [Glycomyces amatae]MCD0447498.1 hypothetical protein [Glycomyces amatae]
MRVFEDFVYGFDSGSMCPWRRRTRWFAGLTRRGSGISRGTPADWVCNPPVVDLFDPETAAWEIKVRRIRGGPA